MREIWVQSLGWEDLLEKEMAPHSSILAWKILWTEEPGGLQFMRLQRVRHSWVTEHSRTAGITFWTSPSSLTVLTYLFHPHQSLQLKYNFESLSLQPRCSLQDYFIKVQMNPQEIYEVHCTNSQWLNAPRRRSLTLANHPFSKGSQLPSCKV